MLQLCWGPETGRQQSKSVGGVKTTPQQSKKTKEFAR